MEGSEAGLSEEAPFALTAESLGRCLIGRRNTNNQGLKRKEWCCVQGTIKTRRPMGILQREQGGSVKEVKLY